MVIPGEHGADSAKAAKSFAQSLADETGQTHAWLYDRDRAGYTIVPVGGVAEPKRACQSPGCASTAETRPALCLECAMRASTVDALEARIQEDISSILAESTIGSRRCPDDCSTCAANKRGELAPSRRGSKDCESGSIASGGSKAHCSCSVCF